MSTDARGHRKIDSNEDPSRVLFNSVTNSINDWIFVANNTARLALPALLTTLGTSATAARPALVRQQDTKQYWEYDGTTWTVLIGPTWTTFTPTLAWTGSAGVMNSGNRIGRYRQLGTVVDVEMSFSWTALGTGEGLGTGTYLFSLPVACAAWYPSQFQLGTGSYVDASQGAVGLALMSSTTSVIVNTPGGKFGSAYPTPQINGGRFTLKLQYDTV
jgi:hypothetical protein